MMKYRQETNLEVDSVELVVERDRWNPRLVVVTVSDVESGYESSDGENDLGYGSHETYSTSKLLRLFYPLRKRLTMQKKQMVLNTRQFW